MCRRGGLRSEWEIQISCFGLSCGRPLLGIRPLLGARRWLIFAARSGAEALFHEVFDEQVEGARDEAGEIASGQCVAHQVASELEFLFERGVGGELNSIAAGGQGFEAFGGWWLEDERLRRLDRDRCFLATSGPDVMDR
jgi:hypothetical protein